MSHKNGSQKRKRRYPTVCVGGYFIPDENIQTYLICLQSCNMQKHQKANFRTTEYVCVQQWWLKVSITHVSWPVTSWNTRSLPTCTRSTMRTGENTVAINNEAKIWTPKLLYYFLKCIKSAMKILCHRWNVHYGNNKNLWNKSNKEKKSSNHDFQMYHGHWWRWCHVISMEFVIGHFYHCMSRSDAEGTCVDWLSSLSASTRFYPIWRLPMMQVGEIPSSYSYLIIWD